MSNIVLVCYNDANHAKMLLQLQRATGLSLKTIKDAVLSNVPLMEIEIFNGSYDAHAIVLRNVLKCIKECSVRVDIFELPEGERFDECVEPQQFRISSEVLENILNEADRELKRQLEGDE